MKRNLPKWHRSLVVGAVVATVVICLLPTAHSQAQGVQQPQGYQTPNFAGMAAANQQPAQQVFPASLLAGGPAAAMGNDYIDAHGKSIVLQTNYCQSCPSGGQGFCPPGAGGGFGGDPMAVDFGGYGTDQCGPHYFDISADVVFLSLAGTFDGLGPLGGVGPGPPAGSPGVLDPSGSDGDYEAGWRIAGRYDIGALAVFEATYMGVYDIGFTDQAVSPAGPATFGLNSVFSNFGNPVPINGLDQAQSYTLDYQADIQSTELSYRRYWVGNNPRVSGTWLLGARYLRFTEDLVFGAEAFIPSLGNSAFSSRSWISENDLVGFQFGGDGSICLRQGLRIDGIAKSGIYNNRYKFTNAADFAAAAGVPADIPPTTVEGNQVAFAAEGGVTLVADILPSWSIRGGYQVLYLNSLATVGGNVMTNAVDNVSVVNTQGHTLMHGFHGGFEYVW